MKIFPAIDIKDKKCVRLIKGDFENKTEYEMSPVEQAGKYEEKGFKNLHIVDLDGALTGEPINTDIIQDIIGKFDLKINRGGVRNFETIQKYIDAGVEKVIWVVLPLKMKILESLPIISKSNCTRFGCKSGILQFQGGLKSRIN